MPDLRGCWTIIEIMVVCAVIVILGAIGATWLMHSLDSARATVCMNNIRQLNLGVTQLTANTPITGIPGVRGTQLPLVQDSSGQSWMEKLAGYGVSTPEEFCCPLSLSDAQPTYGLNPLCGAEWLYYSMQFGGFLLMPAETRPRNTALIKEPGKTVIMVETGEIEESSAGNAPDEWIEEAEAWQPYAAFPLADTTSNTYGKSFDYGYNWANTRSDSRLGGMIWNQYYRPIGRHSENHRAASAFADGHAQMLNIGDLVSPQWKSPECLFDNE